MTEQRLSSKSSPIVPFGVDRCQIGARGSDITLSLSKTDHFNSSDASRPSQSRHRLEHRNGPIDSGGPVGQPPPVKV